MRPRPETLHAAVCSCGQLRAEVDSDPVGVSVCHCLACQRRTGSVFSVQARFPARAVTITGASKEFVRVGDEGTRGTFRFCPECGSTVSYTLEAFEGFVVVPVGAFADPEFPRPTISVYEERMHRWIVMPEDIAHMA